MAVAAAFSVVASVPELVAMVGASLTEVTLTLRVAVLLVAAPSLTLNETVRSAVEGSSLVLA